MASRFVPGGTLDKPTERDGEWLAAQQELEASHRRKQEEEEATRQNDGKTLYQVLQDNKAAKQEAFEESIKLKHQFPTLNDDEADFLYSALEAERAKEQAIRKETSDQLEAFRRRQVEADKVGEGSAEGGREDVDDGGERRGDVEDAVDWSVAAKKRKRTKEKDGLMGFKVRRTSSSAAANHAGQDEEAKEPESANLPMKVLSASSDGKKSEETSTGATTAKSAKLESSPGSLATGNASSPMKAAIGLVGYDSDDDED